MELSNFVIDFIFFIDILVCFKTTYTDLKTGKEVRDKYLIAKRYIKSTFVIDLLATVPFDNILSFSDDYNRYVD